ncbi:hypothetical protein M427DRAFT_55259 [Gonapodya prolifera JEL478]|uniref:Chromatin target of PRMT1 protein C-terminal domain-containing protein n=1 Tax=Gonapodya prolifera (strain JEL478) TaxID=1344416 RepID=A0A139AJF6_GONPJ|nr:hypothetical protein M427DRAFT_55259 [Gonapodya prolifera JEL478]|eukprot:KXS16603.1 hypothetical protein M427DRAFT_55259 [Gonapodya prolifera JEL478]
MSHRGHFRQPSGAVPYEFIPGSGDTPKVLVVNPAVQVSSGTSLSDRFSQLYRKRRGASTAAQSTARYSATMTRRTGEEPSDDAMQEVYDSAYAKGQAPFYTPQNFNAGSGGGGGGGYQRQGQEQGQQGQRRGGGGQSWNVRRDQGDQGGGGQGWTPATAAPRPPHLSGPRPTQPSAPRSWHVVRGAALQPAAPAAPRGGAALGPIGSGRSGYNNNNGPDGYRGGRGGRGRGRGRGGRGGYGGGSNDKYSLDADLDAYMASNPADGASNGAAMAPVKSAMERRLDDEMEAYRNQAGAGAAPEPAVGVKLDVEMLV